MFAGPSASTSFSLEGPRMGFHLVGFAARVHRERQLTAWVDLQQVLGRLRYSDARHDHCVPIILEGLKFSRSS